MTQPNRFTQKLHQKGYKIADFLEYWDITKRTYERWCAEPDKQDKLVKMIEGMR